MNEFNLLEILPQQRAETWASDTGGIPGNIHDFGG
jgi:hypothetical protein